VKPFGIRYPAGTGDFSAASLLTDSSEMKNEEKYVKQMTALVDSVNSQVILLERDKELSQLLSIREAAGRGIELGLGFEKRDIVYELKIPMKAVRENAFALGCKPGDTIEIGFELGKPDRDVYMREMARKAGGDSHLDIKRMGAGRFSNPLFDTYEFWISVKLAESL